MIHFEVTYDNRMDYSNILIIKNTYSIIRIKYLFILNNLIIISFYFSFCLWKILKMEWWKKCCFTDHESHESTDLNDTDQIRNRNRKRRLEFDQNILNNEDYCNSRNKARKLNYTKTSSTTNIGHCSFETIGAMILILMVDILLLVKDILKNHNQDTSYFAAKKNITNE